MSTTPETTFALSPDAAALAPQLSAALEAVTAAERGQRAAIVEAVKSENGLPAVADRYLAFGQAVRSMVSALGQAVTADTWGDSAQRGKLIRAAVDSIPVDTADGTARGIRDLLSTLTGTGAANGPRMTRAAAMAVIAVADGSRVNRNKLTLFIGQHADRENVRLGIAELTTWVNAGHTDPLPEKVKPVTPVTPETPAGETPAVTPETPAVTAAPIIADGTAVTAVAAVTLRQACHMMHRGLSDAELTARVDASPVPVAALPDDVRAALLSALLSSEELARRADDAAGAVEAVSAVDALSALATA